ncbi:hypothetical protein F5Y12DRAFT_631099 [Xylaria sp. FL1777]|nr:hypothetical protein F5Y12DRAFT_631099 [Xylaria sp. FL1777]
MDKTRKRWERTRANMAHNGLDKSPFMPQTFQEYIEFELEATKLAAEATKKKLREREDHAEMVRRHLCAGKPLEQLAGILAIPKCVLDRARNSSPLSPVLFRPSMWTDAVYFHGNTSWPSRTELKEAGNKYALKNHSHFFPVPRINEIDGHLFQVTAGSDSFSCQDPGVSWQYRKIAGWAVRHSRDDCLFEHEAKELDEPTQELELSAISCQTRGLIERIWNMD